MKIKGISPIADHWRTKAEELERSLARKEALLLKILNDPRILPEWVGELIKRDLEQALNERKET